jgi:hypothetical protein
MREIDGSHQYVCIMPLPLTKIFSSLGVNQCLSIKSARYVKFQRLVNEENHSEAT